MVGYACWHLDNSIAAACLTGYALALSFAVTRFGLRGSWRWILASAMLVVAIGIAGVQFLGVDLLSLPLLFSGALSLLLIQVNHLWAIDRQLTRALFHSSTAYSNSVVDANGRLASGLKLLNTVLPLNEAVVFRCDESEGLQAVVRYKSPAPNPQDPRRNAVWREGIMLCQQAAQTGKLATQTTPGQNSSTVAVPLLHESETAGVLLIRLASEFS